MELNTNKAGMEGLDTSKINKIIHKASEGSKFFHHKQKSQEKINAKVSQMKSLIESFSDEQIMKAEQEMTALGEELISKNDLTQTIVHIDMDMFYAAVEMRDDPSLSDKPMAVGGNNMLSTSNYIARKYGVRAAMPGFIAKKLCPELIIVPHNFDKYKKVSSDVQEIFEEYDPHFSPMSLDEAYLDITEYLINHSKEYEHELEFGKTLAEIIVEEIRRKVLEKTRLTASAGIAVNTLLSKVCSDMNKPNGQFYLPPHADDIDKFIKGLHIRKISGIGNVTEQHLKGLGIVTCSDLWQKRGLLRLLFSEISDISSIETIYYDMSEEQTTKLIQKCKSEKVTMNSALCTAIHAAIVGLLKEAGIKNDIYTIAHQQLVNLRRYWNIQSGNPFGNAICNTTMVSYVPIDINKDNFWKLAREFNMEFSDLLQHMGPYKEMAVKEMEGSKELRKFVSEDVNEILNYTYTTSNCGNLTPVFSGEGDHVQATHLSRCTSVRKLVSIHESHTFRGRLLYALDYGPEYISREGAQRWCAKIFQTLKIVM